VCKVTSDGQTDRQQTDRQRGEDREKKEESKNLISGEEAATLSRDFDGGLGGRKEGRRAKDREGRRYPLYERCHSHRRVGG